MKPQKVLSYITPQIVKYQTIDDLLENNKQSSLFDDAVENLSIDNLLENCFVCIIGEPGIGKSRLTDEIQNVFLARHSCPANIHAKSKCTPAYSTPAPAVA